jgi:hypothetical protein
MAFITDVVTPAELTGFVREEVTGGLPFAALFPPREVDDIMYEISQVDLRGTNDVARYRSWDTVPPIGKRPGIQIVGGEIPPLGYAYRLNEQDIGRLGRLRQGVAERSDQRVVDVLFNDARRAANAVQNRLTLAHAELLSTGSFQIAELGNVAANQGIQATFEVPTDQLGPVSPSGADWSDRANAVPADDFIAWEAIGDANQGGDGNGAPFDEWWISPSVMLDLRLNETLRGANPFSAAIGIPARLDEASVATTLADYGVRGRLRVVDIKRPPLAGGSASSVLDDRLVVGVKAGMGQTLYGVPPVVNIMTGNAQIDLRDAPGIVAYSFDGIEQGVFVITRAEAVSMPVLTDPAGLFIASV